MGGANWLANVIAEGQAVGKVVIEGGVGRRGVFILRGVGGQRSFRSQSVVIRDAVLRTDML